ncbi:MAG: hypothetical protein ACPIE8_04965, partial [Henriciella sp.]
PLAVDVHDEVLAPNDFTSLDVNTGLVAARDGSLTARDRPRSGQVPIQLIRFAAGGHPRQFAHFDVTPFIEHHARSGRFLLRCERQCFGSFLRNALVPGIETPDELEELGWDDTYNGLSLVEWPQHAGDRLPRNRLDIEFSTSTESRTATLVGHGEYWQSRINEL